MSATPVVPYLAACPVGCDTPLVPTGLMLPEGPLRRCPCCGQWASAVSEADYWRSMQEFDSVQGTAPAPGAEVRRDRLARRRIDRVLELLGTKPHATALLDVGCSAGTFLACARDMGLRASGVEPAARAAGSARSKGLEVFHGTLDEARLAAGSFDAVTLFEVIEHLREPLALAREAHRILRPGGVFLIGTANTASWTASANGARWEYLHLASHGGHVSFFNPGSMRLLAQRTGFELVCIETRNVRLLERADANPLAYRLAKLAAEIIAWPARGLGRGHDMLAFLRKP